MSQERHVAAARLLGYPADTRLLLINAAVVRAFREGKDQAEGPLATRWLCLFNSRTYDAEL